MLRQGSRAPNLQDELAKYVRERVRPLYVVRFNHIASVIVNANHSIMGAAAVHR
jgi:hypothetical protein